MDEILHSLQESNKEDDVLHSPQESINDVDDALHTPQKSSNDVDDILNTPQKSSNGVDEILHGLQESNDEDDVFHTLQKNSNGDDVISLGGTKRRIIVAKRRIKHKDVSHTLQKSSSSDDVISLHVTKWPTIDEEGVFHNLQILPTISEEDTSTNYCSLASELNDDSRSTVDNIVNYPQMFSAMAESPNTVTGIEPNSDKKANLTIHNKIRPYYCGSCGSGFNKKNDIFVNFDTMECTHSDTMECTRTTKHMTEIINGFWYCVPCSKKGLAVPKITTGLWVAEKNHLDVLTAGQK